MSDNIPAILIFDGNCGFCTSVANYVVSHTTTPIVAHAWQLIDVLDYGLTPAQTAARVYLIVGNERFAGHLAFTQILLLQRNIALKSAGWLLTVPPFCWLGALGYSLVARFRHRLPGGTPACALKVDNQK